MGMALTGKSRVGGIAGIRAVSGMRGGVCQFWWVPPYPFFVGVFSRSTGGFLGGVNRLGKGG